MVRRVNAARRSEAVRDRVLMVENRMGWNFRLEGEQARRNILSQRRIRSESSLAWKRRGLGDLSEYKISPSVLSSL